MTLAGASGVPPLARILIVEDSPVFQELIGAALREARFVLTFASSGAEAYAALAAHEPDVAVLDWVLPDIDGSELCASIRGSTNASVLMLTGRDSEEDVLTGFSSGADDYVTKPFSPRLLVARVDAILARRAPVARVQTVESPGEACVQVDRKSHRARIDGAEVNLTAIEFNLLAALSARPTMVFSRNLLLDLVWGAGSSGDTHLVDVHIANLRKKIDAHGHRHIDTVRGVGYRMAVFEITPVMR